MSGLVDIWTRELAKLREKGQTIWSSSSSPTTNPESTKVVPTEGGTLAKSVATTLVQGIRVSSPGLSCSEASLSMLVDCFSA